MAFIQLFDMVEFYQKIRHCAGSYEKFVGSAARLYKATKWLEAIFGEEDLSFRHLDDHRVDAFYKKMFDSRSGIIGERYVDGINAS